MSEESFPNAKILFRQVFAASDPAHRLLQLLNENPTYPAVRDLVISYFDTVCEDPSCAQFLASVLDTIRHSPNAPTFGQETLDDLLNSELAGTHFKYYDDDSAKEYGPRNEYFLDCLLSGLSLKFGLTEATEIFWAIADGLEGRSEALVVGSCIQLLLSGPAITTEFAGPYKKSSKTVAKKLDALKKTGIVKDPRAIRVLEVSLHFMIQKQG